MGRSGIPCFGLTTNLDAEAFFKRLAAPMRVLSKRHQNVHFNRRPISFSSYIDDVQMRLLIME